MNGGDLKMLFRHGEGSTARIAIARKPVFQLNPKLRCLVLEKNISRTQNKIFLEHKIKYF
jgi:hypothetical protein